MDYAESEIRRVLERGPSPGEDFFRLKVTGNGETRWVNVTPGQLDRIAAALVEPDDDEPADELGDRARALIEWVSRLTDWEEMTDDQARELNFVFTRLKTLRHLTHYALLYDRLRLAMRNSSDNEPNVREDTNA